MGAILTSVALLLLVGAAPIPLIRALFVITIGLLVWTAGGIFNLVASIQALGTVARSMLRRSLTGSRRRSVDPERRRGPDRLQASRADQNIVRAG